MWADNETTVDLLGFDYLVDSLDVLLTQPGLLPLTVGVLGDWGSGKTSLLQMAQERLDAAGGYLTVFFSPWRYEDYEDVKGALIDTILSRLEHAIPEDEEDKRKRLRRAHADLDEILADALEDLQQIEPEAALRNSRPSGCGTSAAGTYSITLSTADARLRIDTWEQGAYGAILGDTMLLACAAVITNRRYDTELNSANLVFEQIGDRLGWQVHRFRPGMIPPGKYPYGPYGRTHGLSHSDFFGKWGRYFMVHPAMHVWQKAVVQLTAETLLDLFREAVDLRPPDPRTGIWPGA